MLTALALNMSRQRTQHQRLTVREAASELGLPVRSVYALMAQGHLPHLRHGKAIRIRREDLVAYEDSRLIGGPTDA